VERLSEQFAIMLRIKRPTLPGEVEQLRAVV